MYLDGSINVKVIEGRRGQFSVGIFHSPLGQFEIRHAVIDQLLSGEYHGTVDVQEIYIDCYRYKGSFISKLCGRVADVQIQTEDGEGDLHPDPLLSTARDHADVANNEPHAGTDSLAANDAPSEHSQAPIPSDNSSPALAQEPDAVLELFGEFASAISRRQPVKLDPAASAFRKQIAYLRTTGKYRYKGQEATWYPEESFPD